VFQWYNNNEKMWYCSYYWFKEGTLYTMCANAVKISKSNSYSIQIDNRTRM
jgi:hypothetical protein